VKLAELKHQRDAIVRARSLSAEPRSRSLDTSDVHVSTHAGDFLSRNYDYYELYTMPQRYLERATSPAPYKQHGRKVEAPRRALEGSGLTRVAEKIASRSTSPLPNGRAGGTNDATNGAVGTGNNGSEELKQSDQDGGGKYHTDKANTSGAAADRTFRADSGGKYRTFCPSPSSASPAGYFNSPSRPGSPGAESNATANVSVLHVAREAIQQRRALSRSKREEALAEFNRKNYLRKDPVQSKYVFPLSCCVLCCVLICAVVMFCRPFQPVLMATETHKIMSRVRSTFEERYRSQTLPMCRCAEKSLTLRNAFYRTTKSVESIVVRREVAKMFPSPGPGRYTGGISIDKLGKQCLSIIVVRCTSVFVVQR
jgi:hypothetical protein